MRAARVWEGSWRVEGGWGVEEDCSVPGSASGFRALVCVLSAALRATHVTLARAADNTSEQN